MPASRTLALPLERHEQLRALAEALSCSLSDAAGHLLDAAGRVGLIPRDLPGFAVERTGDGRVAIDMGKGRRVLPADAAERYAKHILGAARLLPPDAARRYAEHVVGPGVRVLPDSGLGAVKRGAGVKLLDPAAGLERIVAPSVAGEFARQIIAAASHS